MAPTPVSGVAMADPEKHAQETMAIDDVTRGAPIEPLLEKRVVRKLDYNLVPLVSVLYMLSFLDRSNIGNAKIVSQRPHNKGPQSIQMHLC